MSAFDHAGAGQTAGRNGGAYTGVLESCLRTIANAETGKELVVFSNQARELAQYVRAGGLKMAEVITALNEAGGTYVTPAHGEEAVEAALAQAFAQPPELSQPRGTQARRLGRESKFPLLTFAELKASTASPQLIRGLIPRIGLTLVWGPP